MPHNGEADDSGGAGGPASAGRTTDPEAGMSEQTATTPAGHLAADHAAADHRAADHRAADHRAAGPASPAADESLVAEELLVEEVSIDGMCGVY
jgi:mycofactocin precursor